MKVIELNPARLGEAIATVTSDQVLSRRMGHLWLDAVVGLFSETPFDHVSIGIVTTNDGSRLNLVVEADFTQSAAVFKARRHRGCPDTKKMSTTARRALVAKCFDACFRDEDPHFVAATLAFDARFRTVSCETISQAWSGNPETFEYYPAFDSGLALLDGIRKWDHNPHFWF